jgi:hypothetical protein
MIPSKKQMLWWGRSDPDYSRNSVVRQNLAAQGWEIRDFHPKISALGDITAALFPDTHTRCRLGALFPAA